MAMPVRRPCLDCGWPTSGTRCPDCRRRQERTRPTPTQRYGPGYQRRHREVYGQPCALRLPDCTGIATTADHLVPVSRGGREGPLVPACAHCNSAKGNRMA